MDCNKWLLFSCALTLCSGAWAVDSPAYGNLATPDIDDIEYIDDEEPSEREVNLGKMLFFDNRLSKHQNQSCATCHNPELGFSDGLAKGIGSGGDILGRNAPHLYNLAWSSIFFWDGRAKSLEEQALGPIVSDVEMQMTPKEALQRLEKVAFYKKEFKEVYGALTFENIGRAIAAFEMTIISDDSAFDKYLAGQREAMSHSAIRGLKLFVGKARCVKCHDGANFTDDSFHNIGIEDNDDGRFAVDPNSKLKGAFKTPGLRNIIMSAPYMHDGSLASLEEVVEHYDKGAVNVKNVSPLIVPLNLNPQEKADLIAFMAALTDPVVITRPQLPN
ncbi:MULTISPECIES: cytochrome-c peroxidase [Pseudoalteromonas]|uniref:Cytochrome c peroxidase n=1 Tax=Pseudoalteromonas obscura TaxID=3048491 RepID=A0ABT7EJ57_9GAMM|nr:MULTISPECIES: cytochrome c peroxidase [Pseudoalteromonas]MBQ4836649.1 tryptophan tryptophylquinone biosynthesis enzyme MauG [Pseudoalteromonas luteoviolacea]MDK2595077.1 cytochrome c peroxidase [Pseudoalteromonas sp. P94(2023)]